MWRMWGAVARPVRSARASRRSLPYKSERKIALIDRGSLRGEPEDRRGREGRRVGVLIGLVAPGDAVSFSNGGGTNFVPTLVITQSNSNVIKNTSEHVRGERNHQPEQRDLAGTNIASYSSRGPNYSYNMLKPDMSAPGTIRPPSRAPGTARPRRAERRSRARSRPARRLAALQESHARTARRESASDGDDGDERVRERRDRAGSAGADEPRGRGRSARGPRRGGNNVRLGRQRPAGREHFLWNLPAQHQPEL